MSRRFITPFRFIYLDKDGLNSILSQINGYLETEISASEAKSGKFGLSGGFSLRNMISSLLGINVEMKIASEKSSGSSNSIKYELTPENKLNEIITKMYESQEPIIYDNLETAADLSLKDDKSVFVFIKEEFDLPQFSHGKDGVVLVNTAKTIEITKNNMISNYYNVYDDSDNYFKKSALNTLSKTSSKAHSFIMSASLSKCPCVYNCTMSILGHDAVLFRAYNGKNIPLNVFGLLTPLKIELQIKPYAIWI